MKASIIVTFEVDAGGEWADEAAFRNHILWLAVGEEIPDLLREVYPELTGRIKASTPADADSDTRDDLLRELGTARDKHWTETLVDDLREDIAKRALAHPQPRWVVFETDEWDNGHFLSASYARIYFEDGEHINAEFDKSIEETMTDVYGCVGESAGYGVDLRTGEVAFDDYRDNVVELLGIPQTN